MTYHLSSLLPFAYAANVKTGPEDKYEEEKYGDEQNKRVPQLHQHFEPSFLDESNLVRSVSLSNQVRCVSQSNQVRRALGP